MVKIPENSEETTIGMAEELPLKIGNPVHVGTPAFVGSSDREV